jgi:hypothetical protein
MISRAIFQTLHQVGICANLKILLCLAVVSIGGLFGCATHRQSSTTNSDTEVKEDLPIKFADYQEFYTFVAKRTYGGMLMLQRTNAPFILAADSTTEILTLESKSLPYIYLVTPHFYNGGVYDKIRGVQGNGEYYLLRPLATNYIGFDTDKGFELLGIAEGNSCKLSYSNGVPQLVTHSHFSATEYPQSIYEWNGKVFELVK